MWNDSAEILFRSFLQLALANSSGMSTLFFDVVHPQFPLLTMASSILEGALKDGFGVAVMECDKPKPWKFLSLDSCQKAVPVDPHGS